MAGMLDGRVTIVTGAGRGIGAGVARLLASEGAKVVVNDLGGAVDGTGSDLGPAGEVVEEIKKHGGEAVVNGSDVSDFDQAEALVRQAIDTYGKLDVLVNVAGILRDRMIFNMSFEEWDAVVRVHLGGTFNTSRHAAAYWRELRNPEGHFRIINFTSGSGMHGAPGQPNYAAAKNGHRRPHLLLRQRPAALRRDHQLHQPGGQHPHGGDRPARTGAGSDPRGKRDASGQRRPGGRLPGQRALGLVQRAGRAGPRAPDRDATTSRRSLGRSSRPDPGTSRSPPT